MIQEDIEQKSTVIITKGTKITGQLLAKAMASVLRHMRNAKDAPGKQSLKQLSKGGSLESIPVSDDNIKAFNPIARKYGIRYKLVKDASEEPPRWLVFFRSKDAGAMTAAFKEFAHKMLKRENEKTSVRDLMVKLKELIKNAVIDRTRHKERGEPEL